MSAPASTRTGIGSQRGADGVAARAAEGADA
jgi:hypothetical protein